MIFYERAHFLWIWEKPGVLFGMKCAWRIVQLGSEIDGRGMYQEFFGLCTGLSTIWTWCSDLLVARTGWLVGYLPVDMFLSGGCEFCCRLGQVFLKQYYMATRNTDQVWNSLSSMRLSLPLVISLEFVYSGAGLPVAPGQSSRNQQREAIQHDL